nr:MAG TPA: hypothetical protein [Caudoviricetes sp.]DAU92464.1 MAG TPA: hypothetical protein [Caudoviricetes sp.]
MRRNYINQIISTRRKKSMRRIYYIVTQFLCGY